jgi:phosphatidylserine decarboxylase
MERPVKLNDGFKTFIYRDGKIIEEIVEAESVLKFFYLTPLGRFLRFIIPVRLLSKIYSAFQNSAYSKKKISKFVVKHNINISEYVVPENGYDSFNDFFIRKLKPGVREIDKDLPSVVAPADSQLLAIQSLCSETNFFVKSKKFSLEKFFNSVSLAKEYEGGTLLIFRLAPYNYHRFHFPVDCFASAPVCINGKLESVNPIVYKAGLMPLSENERQLVFLDNEIFGKIAFVSIGAMFVGKIVNTYEFERFHKKGEEMGYFSFGGSSIVLVFKKDIIEVDDLFLRNSKEQIETTVKMGERIGSIL